MTTAPEDNIVAWTDADQGFDRDAREHAALIGAERADLAARMAAARSEIQAIAQQLGWLGDRERNCGGDYGGDCCRYSADDVEALLTAAARELNAAAALIRPTP